MDESSDQEELLGRVAAGDESALAVLFTRYQGRLEQMIALRMDARLHGRIDPADVLQETYLEAARRIGEFLDQPTTSLFIWLRFLALQKLVDLMRHHLGAKIRAADLEVSIDRRGFSHESSDVLAAKLLGQLTSPSRAAIRAETQFQVQNALSAMEPIDREILTLRHFEMMSNSEIAEALDLTPAAASTRYIRAIRRLKSTLENLPEFSDVRFNS